VRTLIILTITLVSLTACRDQSPELPTFTGHWAGFAEAGFNVEITASESSGEVMGAGKFSGAQQPTVAFSVTGVHPHPDVVLITRASGFADANSPARSTARTGSPAGWTGPASTTSH
jgi:hypothetical protein